MRYTSLADWLGWLEQSHPVEIDLGLVRIRQVAEYLQLLNPIAKTITVAGTNGKGSCVTACGVLLQSAHYSVGVYTSPHLLHYGERIQINGKPVKEFSFQPFVFRVFEDGLFNRNREPWAELFFIDSLNCVYSIMFNGTTLTELRGIFKKLLYEGTEAKTLCDVVLTVRPEKLTSKNDPTKSWYIGRFSYELASVETVRQLAEFAADCPIYRRDTLKQTASYLSFSDTFALPIVETLELTTGNTETESSSVEYQSAVAEEVV